MRDTDIQDKDANQQADQNAVPDAERAEPAAAKAYDPTRRADDPLSGDEEPAAAPVPDEPAAATDEDRSAELLPGEASAESAAAGWAEDAAEDMRVRWQELQLRFVDDPSGVAGEARALVGEAVHAVTDALTEQQHQLDSWSTDEVGDTEQLRVVVQRYRDFFDRMLDRAI